MSVVRDAEWERLSSTWGEVREGPVDAGWVLELVRRQNRRLEIALVCEVVITIGILGALAWWVVATGSREAVVFGTVALVHSAAVWAFALWNRAGVWRPLGQTTRAYLTLARERCRRERRAARFVIGLLAIEAVPIAWWVLRGERSTDGDGGATAWWLLPGAVVVFFFVWAIRTEVRARRLAERLAQADRALALETG